MGWNDRRRLRLCAPTVQDANPRRGVRGAFAQGEEYMSIEAEKQKPVGRFARFTDGIWREVTDGSPGQPLYAAPQPKREWVGLTDEEMKQVCYEAFSYDPYVIARAIEQALKEKNT
jgi:hypothetical protein